jgi:hypothetical protein
VSANEYREIYDRIADTQHLTGVPGPIIRLVKLQEEVGEVAEALIGFTGANARKGYTHDEEAVAKELADVVITAMVALHDWVPSPTLFMEGRLSELLVRIKREGS